MKSSAPPIVTLTTDFGGADGYVAQLKGALLRHCPGLTIIDITHVVPAHHIQHGAVTLERVLMAFPDGTLHLAVVDPGVGTDRRILVVRWPSQTLICPDNGLATWALRRHPQAEIFELIWRPDSLSEVFHGRDIMAPAAGMLAAGKSLSDLAKPASDPVLLDIAPVTDLAHGAVVIHIDHFGNATTNLPAELLSGRDVRAVRAADRDVGALRRTYGDVAVGQPIAVIGSSGLLEIAVREGSAAERLGLHVGDRVELDIA